MQFTEAQIAAMLAGFDRLLRGERPITIDWTIGLNRYTDDGAWACAEPNGSQTVTIRVDGGAHDTRETWPRNLKMTESTKQ